MWQITGKSLEIGDHLTHFFGIDPLQELTERLKDAFKILSDTAQTGEDQFNASRRGSLLYQPLLSQSRLLLGTRENLDIPLPQ